jgi:hypothetical protein
MSAGLLVVTYHEQCDRSCKGGLEGPVRSGDRVPLVGPQRPLWWVVVGSLTLALGESLVTIVAIVKPSSVQFRLALSAFLAVGYSSCPVTHLLVPSAHCLQILSHRPKLGPFLGSIATKARQSVHVRYVGSSCSARSPVQLRPWESAQGSRLLLPAGSLRNTRALSQSVHSYLVHQAQAALQACNFPSLCLQHFLQAPDALEGGVTLLICSSQLLLQLRAHTALRGVHKGASRHRRCQQTAWASTYSARLSSPGVPVCPQALTFPVQVADLSLRLAALPPKNKSTFRSDLIWCPF